MRMSHSILGMRGLLLIVNCTTLYCTGCLWMDDDTYVMPDAYRGQLKSFDIWHCRNHSFCYEPGFFYFSNNPFPKGDHPAQLGVVLLELLVRLPTVIIEYAYNSEWQEIYSLQIKGVVVNEEKTSRLVVCNSPSALCSKVSLDSQNGVDVPFHLRLIHNSWRHRVPENQNVGEKFFDVLFVDKENNLWVSRHDFRRMIFGILMADASKEQKVLVYKISLETGTITPIVTNGEKEIVVINIPQGGAWLDERERLCHSYGISSVFDFDKDKRVVLRNE